MTVLFDQKPATKSSWSDPTSDAEAHARAAGRARYNRDRKFAALVRRNYVVRRYMELHAERGAKAQIAREFNVHRSTVTRDIRQGSCPARASPPSISADPRRTPQRRRRPTDGAHASTKGATVGELLEQWFSYNEDDWSPTVVDNYRRIIDRHLIPRFGRTPLRRLTTVDIDLFHAQLRKRGIAASWRVAPSRRASRRRAPGTVDPRVWR